jgi:hypothetical protein
VNRTEFQQLAEERVHDADALLRARQWSGAYYLVGYAVECALKACIAKLTNLHDFPDKDIAVRCFTHHIETLVDASGLKTRRDSDAHANAALKTNWLTVKDWNEKARYGQWTESQARKLFDAVSDGVNGVLPWIKGHW